MIGKYKTSNPENVKETMPCPITGEMLTITHAFHALTLNLYSDFLDILYAEFNTGEPNCNIILKKTIVGFFDKYPEHKGTHFMYMLFLYVMNTLRCPGIGARPDMLFYYVSMASKDYLTEAAYQNAPPDFRLFLAQIKSFGVDYYRGTIFMHNCMLIINRLDRFVYALDDDTQHGQVAMPYFNAQWMAKWLIFIVKQLLNDGLLVLNKPGGPIKINQYTQDLLDNLKEGRQMTGPSIYGIDEIQKQEREKEKDKIDNKKK